MEDGEEGGYHRVIIRRITIQFGVSSLSPPLSKRITTAFGIAVKALSAAAAEEIRRRTGYADFDHVVAGKVVRVNLNIEREHSQFFVIVHGGQDKTTLTGLQTLSGLALM